ncbi:MAG: DUF1826 domain-containing protein [Pseudomonadota bacterium]
MISHATADGIEVLDRIGESEVNLSLWQRPADPVVEQELSALEADSLPDVRCWTSSTSFDDDVHLLLKQRHLDPEDFKQWRLDLARIAKSFFALSEERKVALRLETTDGDGCRRFHVDRTQLRLLCTYRGPGTEWLKNEQVDRVALANFRPNECVLQNGEASTFEPFWVGILKGESFPGNVGNGLVHRSPPVSGTDQVRVLFCLDC